MSRRGMSTIEALRIADFSVLGCSIGEENFGFSVGPMGLSKRDAEKLASEVAEAIHMLNNLLLEESGVKLDYAEFELVSKEKGNLPEAMIFATGGGGEETNFIVLLEHEKGLVDVFKIIGVANDVISKLRDVAFACRASGLKKEEEKEVLRRFVERFTRKIYGEASQKKYRERYARDLLTHLKITSGLSVEGRIEVDYGVKPPRLNSRIDRMSFEGHSDSLEYLKSLIFTKTALEVLAGDVALIGRKILSLINDYTVDAVEEDVALRLAESFWSRVKPGSLKIEEIMEEAKFFVDEAREVFRKVEEDVNAIMHSGGRRPLKQHLDAVEGSGLASCFKDTLAKLLSGRVLEEEVWGWSLKDELTSFLEHADRGLKTFEKALSAFMFMVAEKEAIKRILEDYVKQVVDPIRRIMIKTYIEKIGKRLESFIEDRSLGVPVSWDIAIFRGKIKEDLASQLEVGVLFSTVELLEITFNGFISEVPSELRVKVEEVYRDMKEHVSEVVPGLADYLLSHDVFKAFLEQSQVVVSPEEFSRKYFDFVSRDIEELPKWKSLAKTWLEAFASSSKSVTSAYRLVADFVEFVNKLRDEETSTEKPKELLEARVKVQQEKVDVLAKKLSELSNKRTSIEKQIDVLQSQLSSASLVEKNLKMDYGINIATLKELRETLEAKKREMNEIEQKLSSVRGAEADAALQRKSRLEEEIREITAKTQKLVYEVERIDRELSETISTKERFMNALKQLHADLEEVANQISATNAEIEREEAVKGIYVKFLERYSHTLEELLFISHMLKAEVLAFARDKISTLTPSIVMEESNLNEFKEYVRRIFLKSFSYVLLRPLRVLLSSYEKTNLNYIAMYSYPSDEAFRMTIGNNFLSLGEEGGKEG
ncbi:MAG: hypothetical protein QXN15_07750 [Candidatus Jordarchaeales archaeon]|nr:hypothetical protein [Candidatus Jordarchaeia archaeon]